MEKMVAYCGILCTECPTYKATQKNDNHARARIAKEWGKRYRHDFKTEDINCDGCLAVGKRLIGYCVVCDIRKCASNEHVQNCGYCAEYPCDKLDKVHTAAPEAKARLDAEDWRLQGQESYLMGAKLVRKRYRQYPKNPDWDHDHCEFCWATFCYLAGPDHLDHLKEGYTTLDEYRWICPSCFNDFHAMFKWEVIQDPDSV